MIQIIVNIFGLIDETYKDLSTQKYRKELTPNITFQPNKIFVRNDLFEKIIKSCKSYEEICDEKEFVLMSEKSFIQHDVKNKQLKEENEKVEMRNEKVEMRNEKVEMTNENKQFKKIR